ncbi:MAG: hypothetical protein AAGJ83_03865 [Planctomycetota bacterium]
MRNEPRHCDDASDHVAVEYPLTDSENGGVLSFRWKLLLNFVMVCIPALMSLALLPVAWISASSQNWVISYVLPAAMVIAFAAQIRWAICYPEWPMNLFLTKRLRGVWRRRTKRGDVPSFTERLQFDRARMVEWVPRERWSATRLDTAEDVMLICPHANGLTFLGEKAIYDVPSAALIDVHIESVRPKGCFHLLHFAILTARTERAPIEFPIALRDHTFGNLRSSRRFRETLRLVEDIESRRLGDSMSDPFVWKLRNERSSSRPREIKGTTNPYSVSHVLPRPAR